VARALVLGGPLSPIGWRVGFLHQPFEVARRATLDWWTALVGVDALRLRDVPGGDLLGALRLLDPLQTPPYRQLLVGSDTGWTAHFMNNHLGGDSVSWTGHLSRVLGCEAVVATHIPVGDYVYPTTGFDLLGPTGEPPLSYLRSVHAGVEARNRWTFQTRGAVQSFEAPERYGAPRVRDRLTRELLIRYLGALGIEPDRETWWSDALVIEQSTGQRGRESTVEETRHEYGIRET